MKLINFDEAIKAMDELENEDIEAYGCKIPEGFDGERARSALCLIKPIMEIPEDCTCGRVFEKTLKAAFPGCIMIYKVNPALGIREISISEDFWNAPYNQNKAEEIRRESEEV